MIRSFNLETGSHKLYEGHKGWVNCLEIYEDRLFSGGDEGEKQVSEFGPKSIPVVLIWDIKTTKILERLVGHDNSVTCICFAYGNLYTGSMDHHIFWWSLKEIEDRIEERAEMY